MHDPNLPGKQQRQRRQVAQPQVVHQWRPIPWPPLAALLRSPHNRNVRYLRGRAQFWYRPDPSGRPDEWKRAYGLTYMLGHAFWPTYDRSGDTNLSRAIDQTKRQYYAKRSQQLKAYNKRRANDARKWGGQQGRRRAATRGTKTTRDIQQLSAAPPKEPHGSQLGELVHKQLHVWAVDRLYGTRQFGVDRQVEWPANERTQAIIQALTHELRVDVRFGEFMIYDPRVPVATSIDLLGWSKSRQAVVVIEIKTGSKWNREMGTAPMRGRAARVLRLNNSPLNQAIAQLACTTAIVQQVYGVARVEALLIWANRWLVPVPQAPKSPTAPYPANWQTYRPCQTEVQLYKRWLSDSEKRMGRIMLVELHQHLQARGGRAWAKPRPN